MTNNSKPLRLELLISVSTAVSEGGHEKPLQLRFHFASNHFNHFQMELLGVVKSHKNKQTISQNALTHFSVYFFKTKYVN